MKALGPFEVSAVSGGRTGLGLGIIIRACEVMSVSDEVMSSSQFHPDFVRKIKKCKFTSTGGCRNVQE